jgi:chromosomal replication initiator protein
MSGATARQPTETELKAHQRRTAFREKIAEKAAALELQKEMAEAPAEVVTVEFPAPLRVSEIQIVICEAFGCDLVELNATRRTARIVRARQVGMYLAKVLTGRSLPEIGRRFGGRDHTTVLHAVRKIAAKVDFASETPELFDPELSDFVNALRTDIQARRSE